MITSSMSSFCSSNIQFKYSSFNIVTQQANALAFRMQTSLYRRSLDCSLRENMSAFFLGGGGGGGGGGLNTF